MRTIATWKTAALTGAWSFLGMTAFEAWEKNYSVSTAMHNVVFFSMVALCFFGPTFFFVIGSQTFNTIEEQRRKYGIRTLVMPEHWKEMGAVWIRMVFWFLGAIAFGIPFTLLTR